MVQLNKYVILMALKNINDFFNNIFSVVFYFILWHRMTEEGQSTLTTAIKGQFVSLWNHRLILPSSGYKWKGVIKGLISW